MPVKPSYLILAGAGALVAVSGIKGWSIGKSLRDVLKGNNPNVNPQLTSQITAASFTSTGLGYGYGFGGTPGAGGGQVNAQGYANPLQHVIGLSPSRVDQGVDYNGSGPILAIGSGRVTSTFNPGWPGGAFICIRLSSGPYKGKYAYFAENISPTVHVGQRVTAGQQIGIMHGGIECGWALPPGLGTSMALANGQFTGSNPTAYGASFNRLMTALGAPSGQITGVPRGSINKGYP